MIIFLQVLSCNSGSQSLQVAIKKVGNSVGNSTFGGLGKGRVSGDLELLVITPTAAKGFHFYYSINTSVGAQLSVGATFGSIDFNEKSGFVLDKNTFAGFSQGLSLGYEAISFQTVKSFADGKAHAPFSSSTALYTGELGGLSTTFPVNGLKLGGGAVYYYSFSHLISGANISWE